MADLITLTATPVRATGSSNDGLSRPWSSRDVSAYNLIELDIQIQGWEGASGSGLAGIGLMTGFQREGIAGWYMGAFASIPQGSPRATLLVDGWQFRYLNWRLVSLSGASAISVWIRGMARYRDE